MAIFLDVCGARRGESSECVVDFGRALTTTRAHMSLVWARTPFSPSVMQVSSFLAKGRRGHLSRHLQFRISVRLC